MMISVPNNLLIPSHATRRRRQHHQPRTGSGMSPWSRVPRLRETIRVHLHRTGSAAPLTTREIIGQGQGQGQAEEDDVPSCLRKELLPSHVAIIMDGNSRWARSRGLPVFAGHEAGYRSLKNIVTLSCRWGIPALTVFAFSSENWLRPKAEVDFLMMLFESVLKENLTDFIREGVRVRIIGDSSRLPESLKHLAKEVENITGNNSRLELTVAISYSGRQDIVQACQKIARKVRHGLLEPAEITESLLAQELEGNCPRDFPCPDLLIRTSGELRLSNFLLWQLAYTELFFAKSNWPDFGEADYIEALYSFQRRQRRFGQRTIQEWYGLGFYSRDISGNMELALPFYIGNSQKCDEISYFFSHQNEQLEHNVDIDHTARWLEAGNELLV